jgi:hypothetical protein
MKPRFISTALAAALVSLLAVSGLAQTLDGENRLALVLNDGTQVVLYGKAGSRTGVRTNEYYYLPTNLRLSKNSAGEPEFVFLKYVTDAREDAGGVSGALMHFLMEWGLTEQQLKEAREKLKQLKPGAQLLGPAAVETNGERSFEVKSATLSSQGQTLNISGSAPVFPGGKVVTAAKMDKYAAQLLVNTFDKATSDVSLVLRFNYRVMLPAAKGRIIIDWRKIYEKYQKDSASFASNEQRTDVLGGLWSYTTSSERSYSEVRKGMESLISQRYIIFEFQEMDPNSEKAKPIKEGFMSMLTQMLGELNQGSENKPPSHEEAEAMPDIKTGTSYKFVREKFMRKVQMGYEEIRLDYVAAYNKPIDVTQNLKSWYTNLKDNPRCVASVNLNDPFFARRDMNFVLDERTKDMFEDKEINYVTVNVRKRRSTGNDFTDRLTIDKKFLTDKGLRAALTYARGDDRNTDEFEYQSQWSFAGGFVYPKDPSWEKGSWETNSLAAPLEYHKMEFQTDIEKLKEAKIVRAALQVRYKKFNEEREVTIPISTTATEPLVSKNVYADRDLDGYVYRVIYYTSEGERLATEWSPKLSDWFVFAAVPEALRDKTSEFFKKAADAGKVIAGVVQGGKVPSAETVLDKFKDVLGIVTK